MVAALWLRWSPRAPLLEVDVEVYVRAGRAILDGAPLYPATTGLPFTYPPFAAVLFVPLALAGSAAPAVLLGVSLVALAGSVAVVGRSTGAHPLVVVLAGLGAVALEPVFRTLSLGQVNLVLMAVVLGDLLTRRHALTGVGVGLAAAVKLTPAFFVLWFLVRRDLPSALRAAVTFLLASAVGAVVAPADSRLFWTGRASALDTVGDEQLTGANQSLRSVLGRLLADATPSWWLVGPACLVVAAVSVLAAHRARAQPALAVSALALGALLVSPVSWTHHWVWLVPLVLTLVGTGRVALGWVTAAVAFLSPMWLAGRPGTAALHEPLGVQVLDASYALLAVVVLALLARPGRGRPALRGRAVPRGRPRS